MDKIRVLQLIPNLYYGGAQILVCQLVKYLNRDMFLPVVVTWRGGPLEERIRDAGVPVVQIPAFPRRRRMSELSWQIKKYQPDILHTHLFIGGFYGRMASIARKRIGIVRTHHGMTFQNKTIRRLVFESLMVFRTDGIVAVSESVQAHILRSLHWNPDQVQVIANGIETERFLPWRGDFHDIPVIAAVGRLSAEKGYDDLIRAIKILDLQGIRLKCIIAGDGPEASALKNLVFTEKLENIVLFAGNMKDVAPMLISADMFVLPSHEEGLSLALLEAMASGLPVVATAVGGTVDVLRHDNGCLVRPRDPRALASGINSVLSSPETAMEKARRARSEAVEKYSIQYTVAAYEALYKKIQDGLPTKKR